MSAAQSYLDDVLALLDRLGASQSGAIEDGASMIADAWRGGGVLAVAHTNHVLHEEAIFRSGGPLGVVPLDDVGETALKMTADDVCDMHITALTNISVGDVVLIHTNSGTNLRTVDTALIAKDRGARTIALTQLPFELSDHVSPWHPSGQRLSEVADVTIDLGGTVGDAAVALPGVDVRVGPTSGATGVIAMWMLLSRAAELICDGGKLPFVLQSIQCPGSLERNQLLLAKWHATGLAYE